MQLTWLDLLAANIAGALWLWGVMAARQLWRTERKKTVPGFLLVVFVGFGLILSAYRAGFWYHQMIDAQSIIVPQAQAAVAP
mgnify:CR=1 FL=1